MTSTVSTNVIALADRRRDARSSWHRLLKDGGSAHAITTDSFAPQPGPARGQAQGPGTISAELLTALLHLQQQVNPVSAPAGPVATFAVLPTIKARLVALPGGAKEAKSIDVVAQLFEQIFADHALPHAIKAQLARLQIPVLKVALTDKRFFSSKLHPARRLLNALADAALPIAGESCQADPLFLEVARAVERVQSDHGSDCAVFELCLETLQAFRATCDHQHAEMVERSARALHENEKRETARQVAQEALLPRIAATTPPPVVALLQGPWLRALERLYLRDAGRGPAFAEALDTADQLIWSVTPKSTSDDRKNLVTALPVLLQRLQSGLDLVDVSPDDRERFFAALIDCHAVAVKAGLRGENAAAPLTDTPCDAPAAPFASMVAEEAKRQWTALHRSGAVGIRFEGSRISVEEIAEDAFTAPADIRTAGKQPTAVPADLDMGALAAVRRGAWLSFAREDGRQLRARLSWVSPLKGVYLFTNPHSMEALSLTPAALLSQFRQGSACLLDDTPLIERVVARLALGAHMQVAAALSR